MYQPIVTNMFEVMCPGLGVFEPTLRLFCSSISTLVPLLLLAACIAAICPFIGKVALAIIASVCMLLLRSDKCANVFLGTRLASQATTYIAFHVTSHVCMWSVLHKLLFS